KDHPLPAAMIGAGVLWLIKQSMGTSSRRDEQHYPSVAPPRTVGTKVRDTVEQVAESVAHGGKSAGTATPQAVSAAGATVSDAARSTGSYIAEKASAAGSSAQKSARKTADWT